MGEFAGYKCDGPNCDNTVNKNSEEARGWLLVEVERADGGYKERFSFCSYNCFHENVFETLSSQKATFA